MTNRNNTGADPVKLAEAFRDALERYKGKQGELGGWLLMNADRILAALNRREPGEGVGVVELLEYVRTSYRMDVMRLRELGRTTAQADEAIARIDAALDTGRDKL